MTYTDYAREAHQCRLSAKREYRRSRSDARSADKCYQLARAARERAAWLTSRPDLWMADPEVWNAPALVESNARELVRAGDIYLRSSFRASEQLAFYRELARKYDELEARRVASRAPATIDSATTGDELLSALVAIDVDNRDRALSGRGLTILRAAADLCGVDAASLGKRGCIRAIVDNF